MNILELFSGTESFSKVARERGHKTFTIDNNQKFNPDLCKDILNINIKDIPFKPDIIWASPPCTAFSVAVIGRNWNKNSLVPKNSSSAIGLSYVLKTIEIINKLKPKYWFIENPRGMLRKFPFMFEFERNTITYCQYGDTRMKPTDIWTNCINWKPKPMCKNGDKCHVSAPRGSKTGTQGLKNNIERSIIPRELCLEIIRICEQNEREDKKD